CRSPVSTPPCRSCENFPERSSPRFRSTTRVRSRRQSMD
ncbi:MAG: hypothetical protein AVDCRST_MAG87-2030, partial [uncultured Thermomicrobiales bacterium]